MDFGVLPPEVNSGRMYAGPGAGSLLAAAAAWSRLAGEVGAAARAVDVVVAELSLGWLGPAAAGMAAAAAPYVGWMNATAVQAEQAGARAAEAAGAFEEAYAAVVPPPVIAANRSRLAGLVATNVFGQNSAAIAAVEAQYGRMWARDVVVMYGYAARSAAAARVTAFAGPPPVADPAGLAGRAAAVAPAAGGGVHSQLSQLISAIPQALQGVGPTTGSVAPLTNSLTSLQAAPVPSLSQLASYLTLIPRTIVPFNDAIKTILYGMVQYSRNLTIDLDTAAASSAATSAGSTTGALTSVESVSLTATVPTVSAGFGNAGLVGKLTVPAGWADSAPAVKMIAAMLPDTGAVAAPTAVADVPTGIFADMALASLAGRAIAGSAPRSRPAAVMNGHAQGRLERLVTELAGTHDVQHWHVDPNRLDSLLEELSQQPGVHAVHLNHDGQADPKLPPQTGSPG